MFLSYKVNPVGIPGSYCVVSVSSPSIHSVARILYSNDEVGSQDLVETIKDLMLEKVGMTGHLVYEVCSPLDLYYALDPDSGDGGLTGFEIVRIEGGEYFTDMNLIAALIPPIDADPELVY